MPELLLLGGQDERLGLVAQAGHDRRHHDAREIVAHDPAEHEGDPLPPLHELRRAVALEEVAELFGDTLRPSAAEGLIDEGDGELLAARVFHHAGEPPRLGLLLRRLLGSGLAQQRGREVDGAAAALLSGHRGEPPRSARSSPWPSARDTSPWPPATSSWPRRRGTTSTND